MGPEKETTRGSCGTWAESRYEGVEWPPPNVDPGSPRESGGTDCTTSGTSAMDERLVGREEKQHRDKTRGEARRLSFTPTMVARKASRQLCTSMGTTTSA